MIKDYLTTLADDLQKSHDMLDKISQASTNKHVADALDAIAKRLKVHASLLNKITDKL